jgi:hypothetical protein
MTCPKSRRRRSFDYGNAFDNWGDLSGSPIRWASACACGSGAYWASISPNRFEPCQAPNVGRHPERTAMHQLLTEAVATMRRALLILAAHRHAHRSPLVPVVGAAHHRRGAVRSAPPAHHLGSVQLESWGSRARWQTDCTSSASRSTMNWCICADDIEPRSARAPAVRSVHLPPRCAAHSSSQAARAPADAVAPGSCRAGCDQRRAAARCTSRSRSTTASSWWSPS